MRSQKVAQKVRFHRSTINHQPVERGMRNAECGTSGANHQRSTINHQRSTGCRLSASTLLRTLRVWLVVKLIIQISKGIIRDQRTRRAAMFYGVLIALIMLFVGAVFVERWLAEHILFFIFWWGACAWLTLLIVLLAFFDMLAVRAAARRERRRLESRFIRRPPEDAGHDDAS